MSVALHDAIDRGDADAVGRELEANKTLACEAYGEGFDHLLPIERAAKRGHLAVCQLLVERFAVDVNQRNPKHASASALWFAADNGHVDVVAFLKQHGATTRDADEGEESSGDYEHAGLNFDSDDD